MTFYNTIWWILFFICGILMQRILPGIDVLVVGLIISLQERNPIQIISILLISIIIQEGCGTLDFGISILWYSLIIISFFVGCWLFEAENLLFIILLSTSIGLSKYCIMMLMIRLQSLPNNTNSSFILNECILQSLLIPIIWKIVSLIRPWGTRYENKA